MRPATLELDVYVGEPRVYRLTFTGPDEVTPLVLSGVWAAQARHNPAAKAAVDIDVNTTEMGEGVLVLTIPGAELPNRSARWVWDLEGETWGTVLAGPLIVSPEVTRVGETTGGSITDLVIALGPDEVKVVSSAQIGPRGLPGDDGREVELSTSATHVQWRYAGDAEWTDLVALADLAGEDGDDGTEVELGTSATHIQWRYVGGVWADLVALADLKGEPGEDGFGVPDPAGQDADQVPVTDGAGAYALGERGITQQAADAAFVRVRASEYGVIAGDTDPATMRDRLQEAVDDNIKKRRLLLLGESEILIDGPISFDQGESFSAQLEISGVGRRSTSIRQVDPTSNTFELNNTGTGNLRDLVISDLMLRHGRRQLWLNNANYNLFRNVAFMQGGQTEDYCVYTEGGAGNNTFQNCWWVHTHGESYYAGTGRNFIIGCVFGEDVGHIEVAGSGLALVGCHIHRGTRTKNTPWPDLGHVAFLIRNRLMLSGCWVGSVGSGSSSHVFGMDQPGSTPLSLQVASSEIHVGEGYDLLRYRRTTAGGPVNIEGGIVSIGDGGRVAARAFTDPIVNTKIVGTTFRPGANVTVDDDLLDRSKGNLVDLITLGVQ